jgi:hypothetical protein
MQETDLKLWEEELANVRVAYSRHHFITAVGQGCPGGVQSGP